MRALSRMKAALLAEYAAPLVLAEISRPSPGPGQILLRVDACGVCHTDVHLARGEWERFKGVIQLPLVLGHEVAGRVAAVGPGVSRFSGGERVGVAWFHHTCENCEYCRRGLEVFCETPDITGVTVSGGFAEYMLAWESHAIPIPEGLPAAEAAPLFCAGATVYSALEKVQLGPGAHLAVWGTGGLGHLAVQLARRAGTRVTAVDVHPSKLEAARRLGAEAAVTAQEAAGWFEVPQHRPDVALVCADSVEAYQGALQSLRKCGVLLMVGLPSRPLSWTAADLIRSGIRVVPSRVSSRRELEEILALAAMGEVHAEVRRHSLEEINQVMDRLGRGEVSGRAVIDFGLTR